MLIRSLSFISLLALATGPLQAAPEFRLGVVDFQRALNGVDEGKTAKEKLKTEFESKQKDLNARKEKLDKLQKELENFSAQRSAGGVLKPELIEKGQKTEQAFRTQLEEYTKIAQSHQKEIADKEMRATQDIILRLRGLMTDLARDGKYSMVLESNESGLVYASESTDLTEKLIQSYNARFKAKK